MTLHALNHKVNRVMKYQWLSLGGIRPSIGVDFASGLPFPRSSHQLSKVRFRFRDTNNIFASNVCSLCIDLRSKYKMRNFREWLGCVSWHGIFRSFYFDKYTAYPMILTYYRIGFRSSIFVENPGGLVRRRSVESQMRCSPVGCDGFFFRKFWSKWALLANTLNRNKFLPQESLAALSTRRPVLSRTVKSRVRFNLFPLLVLLILSRAPMHAVSHIPSRYCYANDGGIFTRRQPYSRTCVFADF